MTVASNCQHRHTRRWETLPANDETVQRLAKELDLPRVAATILAARGISDPDKARQFLSPRLSELSDPFLIPDMHPGVDRIWAAIKRRERIVIFGDYDVDGLTSTTLLYQVLVKLGAEVHPFVPHRVKDGYGMTQGAVDRCLAEHSPQLLVTVDSGTGSNHAVSSLRDHGVDVVITDHHEPSSAKTGAVAEINPKRADDPTLHDLAGVGVAFKLCHAMVKHGLSEHGLSGSDIDLREWLDLVAVGTIADVVSLQGENRTLAYHGLNKLRTTRNHGLSALMDAARIKRLTTSAYHVSFVLGPRLNAPGRIGSASDALDLLLAPDPSEAQRLAKILDAANADRKKMETRILDEAIKDIDSWFDKDIHFGLVVGSGQWHPGTVGIVASRLVAQYTRPAVVVAFDDGMGRGSGRSLKVLNLLDALDDCDDLLQSHGGHQMAAGVVLDEEQLLPFRERFNEACAARLSGQDLRPAQRIDAWMDGLQEADEDLLDSLRSFRPFGIDNPTPVLGIRCLDVVGEPKIVGKRHLRMTLGSESSRMGSIAFGMADRQPSGKIDIAACLEEDTYRGAGELQLNVKDFRPFVSDSEIS